ncbi:hypothetical protein AB0I02_45965 [Streptomyces phaeochromogenes]
MSPEAQRNAFVWFCGVIVFLWLMQVMVTSEAAKELIEDAATVVTPTALAMLVAGKGWDRVFTPAREEDAADGE